MTRRGPAAGAPAGRSIDHRPVRALCAVSDAPRQAGWTYTRLRELWQTVEALHAALDAWPRPAVAVDLLDALRAAVGHRGTLTVDAAQVTVELDGLAVSIALPTWATALLEPLAGEVPL